MPSVEAPHAGYTPLPQSPESTPNVIGVKGRSLAELSKAFADATGDPNAKLRVVEGAPGLQVLVPSSPSTVPTMWTRFKASLSNLPLLNQSGTLRAARTELASQPLNDTQLTHEILSAIYKAEGKGGDHAVTKRAARLLKKLPLTQRNVNFVLQSASLAIGKRQIGATLAKTRQKFLEKKQAAFIRQAERLEAQAARLLPPSIRSR